MDDQKLAFFLSRYRALDTDELLEIARRTDLADEALKAAEQVCAERNLTVAPAPGPDAKAPAYIANQTKLSSELWHSPLSKRVQFQFSMLAIVFGVAAVGAQGLRLGALWVVLLAGGLSFVAGRFGRKYTRGVCSNGDRTIEEKRSTLRTTSWLLWPAMLPAALLGGLLANALR